jgi:hypothetical protein
VSTDVQHVTATAGHDPTAVGCPYSLATGVMLTVSRSPSRTTTIVAGSPIFKPPITNV